MKNYINNNTGILIRIDDVCENMNWDLMKKSELSPVFMDIYVL